MLLQEPDLPECQGHAEKANTITGCKDKSWKPGLPESTFNMVFQKYLIAVTDHSF